MYFEYIMTVRKDQSAWLAHLRPAREKAGATLADFAERVGISVPQLSRIERSLVAGIDLDTAYAIHQVYRVPLASLRRETAA